MSKKIKLIIGSTRQGRVSKQLSEWLVTQATEAGHNLEIVDLKELDLPMFDWPKSPAAAPVDTPEAKVWAGVIADSEGLVFLSPEYNASIPASLKNAIDYLYAEWDSKPAAIISYGFGGGEMAAKHLRDILNRIKTTPIEPDTQIAFNRETFDQSTGKFANIDASLSDSKESFLKALQAIEKA